jgi:hypothetical protein
MRLDGPLRADYHPFYPPTPAESLLWTIERGDVDLEPRTRPTTTIEAADRPHPLPEPIASG